MFLEILQNSQEDICARDSSGCFWIFCFETFQFRCNWKSWQLFHFHSDNDRLWVLNQGKKAIWRLSYWMLDFYISCKILFHCLFFISLSSFFIWFCACIVFCNTFNKIWLNCYLWCKVKQLHTYVNNFYRLLRPCSHYTR